MAKDWIGNQISIFKTLGANNHTNHDYEENGFYATDPIAIDKLKKVFEIPHSIYEPMCGQGHLSERLIKHGHEVWSTDLINRGYGETGVNFFDVESIEPKWSILTNPNYKYAMETVLHSLDLVSKDNYVIMFLKVQFLEGKKRKVQLYDKYPPKYVFISSERITCALNADFERMIKGGGSAVAYGWFVWQKGWEGETVIKWI
jgi:hypothetical protein